MRWSVVILVVFGLLAAAAAAVLVGVLQINPNRAVVSTTAPSSVAIYQARGAIPAMTVIDQRMFDNGALVKSQVAPDKVPAGAVTEPLQANGKMVTVSIAAGQVLTTSSFAAPSAGVELAAHLQPGKRVCAVTILDAGALPGILYPGCLVDVLVAIKRGGGDEAPRTVSTMLLENIQVLAIDTQTVVTPRPDKKDGEPMPAPWRSMKVALEVDPQQAKALQLAEQSGIISLALRNPLDKTRVADAGPVTLKLIAGAEGPIDKTLPPSIVPFVATGPASPVATTVSPVPPTMIQTPPHWTMTVIRGGAIERQDFPMPEGQK